MSKIHIAIIIIIIVLISIIGVFFAINNFNQDEIPGDSTYVELLFNDIPTSHPACEAIRYVTQRDIMTASGDNNFYPDKFVTKGEFAKILALASLNNANFQDISGEEKINYIDVLEEKEILKKEDINTNDFIIKSDVAIYLAKADLKIKGSDQRITDFNYTDLDGIDEVGKTLICHSIARGFVSSEDAKIFNPNNKITRAELASIIYLFINN